MKIIYKYPLKFGAEDIATVELPLESEPLHIDLQNDRFFLWAMVDTDFEMTEDYRFMLKGTGHEIPNYLVLERLNSFLPYGGTLVFHAFKVLS